MQGKASSEERFRIVVRKECMRVGQRQDQALNAIELSHVQKQYNGFMAVQDLSFEVRQGEVFGLLGPNGAGKSTTIRMMMDIIKPDSGVIRLFGQPMSAPLKDRIGYLPEERGLYRNARVLETLVYLAQLKGMTRQAATERAMFWLKRVDLGEWAKRKLNELSKGMQQKVQLVATIVHAPALVVLDEPFSGLDPLNIELVKDIIRELVAQGSTIILSTHQLAQAEVMCDRLLLIHRGHAILYGALTDIRKQFTQHAVRLDVEGDLTQIHGIARLEPNGVLTTAYLREGVTPQDILRDLIGRQMMVHRFELATPPLDAIFIAAVEGQR